MASNILSFLSGLSSGGVDRYQKLGDEARKTKQQNDELVAKSLDEKLKDENLLPEEADHLLRTSLKLRGMDNKTIDAISQAHGYFRQALGQNNKPTQSAASIPPPQDDNSIPYDDGQASGSIGGSPFGDIPTFSTEATAKAPTESSNSFQTVGDLNYQHNRPKVQQQEIDKATAVREAARIATVGTIEDKIAISKKYKGTPYEASVNQLLGMTPKAAGGASTYLPGQGMRGADIIARYPQSEDVVNGKIHPQGLYNVSVGPDKITPVGFFPREEQTAGSGIKTVLTPQDVATYQNDLSGKPLVAGSMAVPIRSVSGGRVVGYIPETELSSFAVTHGQTITMAPDGTVISTPTTTTREEGKGLPGQGPIGAGPANPGPLGSIPAPPPGVLPGSPASGASPGPTIPPSSPKAQLKGAGAGTPRVLSTDFVHIPEGEITNLGNSQKLVSEAQVVKRLLPKVQAAIGPISGQVSGTVFNNIGGYGLNPETQQFFTTLREMIATQAFARGGKTLPQSEQRIYTAQLPKETDTVGNLISKLSVFLPLWERDYQNQLKGLSKNQKDKFLGQGAFGDAPKPTPGTPQQSLEQIFKGTPQGGNK